MSYDAVTHTFTVGRADELNQAIADLDAVTRGGVVAVGAYSIKLSADITLGASAGGNYADVDGSTLLIGGATVAASR